VLIRGDSSLALVYVGGVVWYCSKCVRYEFY